MSTIKHTTYLLLLLLISLASATCAQEYMGPLYYNRQLAEHAQPHKLLRKTTASNPLSLPFFEDFTGYGLYPDSSKWTDYEVYINNTMCVSPICRGVATFDDLTWRGIPYDSFSNTNFRYADSLTSQPINLDLGTVTPQDSVYFSFFYQPQGNGFFPVPQDSLMLFFRTRFGGFVRVWSVPGTTLQPFTQVMIPIVDSFYFDSSFQFRFVNKAALGWADAIWNVDYIRLNSGRSAGDTSVGDIGYSTNPTCLLNDYSSMPYRQFMANNVGETAGGYFDSLHNNNNFPQTVNQIFSARALNTGTLLQGPVINTVTIPPFSIARMDAPAYGITIPLSSVGLYDKVVFENKYFIESPNTSDPRDNDTIVKDQIFDNYLAYDDGSAEKSYYLNLFPSLPGKIAVEYHLNQPDSLRGVAIYFGRQVPFASYKIFSIAVYSALAGVNGAPADVLLYQQDFLSPSYADTINHFWVYRFDSTLLLPSGTFYTGTIQPAASGSDSLYIGLDVNRTGGNHTYYNVLSTWNPSLISGALMIRPMLGEYIAGSAVATVAATAQKWQLMPNPANDQLAFAFEGGNDLIYHIADIRGCMLLEGRVAKGKTIDIARLQPGMYFVSLSGPGMSLVPQKLIKL